MSRYVMAQAGMLLTLFAFTPVPAHAQSQELIQRRPDGTVIGNTDRNERRENRGSRNRQSGPSDARIRDDATRALAATNTACDVSDTQMLGRLAGNALVIEVACSSGPGYIVTTAEPPAALNCLIVDKQAQDALAADPEASSPRCQLPSNMDVVGITQPWVQTLNLTCTVDQARWLGRTASGADRYEIGCAGAQGYWIEVGQDGTAATSLECLQVPADAGTCEFTTAEETGASVRALLTGSPAADCAPSQARYMGANENGRFYELKCASGAGQVVRLASDGAFQQAYDCAQAANIGDGCQLSDVGAAVAAQGEQRAARLAELGRPCTVTDQRVIGREGDGAQREVVEFGCSDAPLGLVALFAAEGAQGSEAIDCLTAKGRSLTCQFTTEDQIKGVLGQMLQASNRDCDVSDYRIAGLMAEGDGQVIEVKCASGSGFLGEFPATRTATGQVQTCAQAAQVGDRCEL